MADVNQLTSVEVTLTAGEVSTDRCGGLCTPRSSYISLSLFL
jgi:hypothetical protein